jgi:hypothetical protein
LSPCYSCSSRRVASSYGEADQLAVCANASRHHAPRLPYPALTGSDADEHPVERGQHCGPAERGQSEHAEQRLAPAMHVDHQSPGEAGGQGGQAEIDHAAHGDGGAGPRRARQLRVRHRAPCTSTRATWSPRPGRGVPAVLGSRVERARRTRPPVSAGRRADREANPAVSCRRVSAPRITRLGALESFGRELLHRLVG